METQLIVFLLLGFSAYWLIKVRAAIVGTAPVKNCKEFLLTYMVEFFLSVVGVLLVVIGGDGLPDAIGKVDSPLSAFAVGGSIPSISMNVLGMFLKK